MSRNRQLAMLAIGDCSTAVIIGWGLMDAVGYWNPGLWTWVPIIGFWCAWKINRRYKYRQ